VVQYPVGFLIIDTDTLMPLEDHATGVNATVSNNFCVFEQISHTNSNTTSLNMFDFEKSEKSTT
jgi:hypothetical protein